MLPFTVEQFFAVFRSYNAALWPAVIIAYGLGGLALRAALSLSPVMGRTAALVLAAMWAWTGIAYHGVYFAPINPAALVFAALFVAQAALLAYVGAAQGGLQFASSGWRRAIGWALILYTIAAYPLIGLWSGHAIIDLPHFGVTPCPVTLFTLGVLLLLKPPVPWKLLVIPVIWSLIGGSAAFLLRVPQDWPLLASGALTLAVMAATRKRP